MKIDKSLLSGTTVLLVLSLLQQEDQYGYQMIAALSQRSGNVFQMKEGTLYPCCTPWKSRDTSKVMKKRPLRAESGNITG